VDPRAQLAHALRSPRPFEDLLRVFDGLSREGIDQEAAYRAGLELLAEARQSMGEGEVQAVLGVLDVVCGFCLPGERIFPGELRRAHREATPEAV
jgi:hypothetical protein